MKFWIGITDKDWFDFLAAKQPDEVNFWQPAGGRTFKALQSGEPFLFKLHSPLNFIVGGGYFVKHTVLPLSIAWEDFGEKNGASDKWRVYEIVRKYRERRNDMTPDPLIGCIVLTEPFFFDRADWIPVPDDWPRTGVMQGKTYSTDTPTGEQLWTEVQTRLSHRSRTIGEARNVLYLPGEREARFGKEYLQRARLGQGAFRVLVTDAYQRRCAITGERTLPVLQAAHIRPHAQHGPNIVRNGLFLRSDLHILFDRGLLTIDPEYRVNISDRIREEYENGRDYYRLSGQRLMILPGDATDHPSREFLEWHGANVFSS